MTDGNCLKNSSLSKTQVVIHRKPLFERVFGLVGSVVLTLVPIVCLCLDYENQSGMIVLLFAMLVFCFLMYLDAFKEYICFDTVNKDITIRKGFKKEKLSTINLLNITVVNDLKHPELFSLNFNFRGYVKKDYSWSTGPWSRVFFGSICTQRKRLEKFCEECNQYLNNQ